MSTETRKDDEADARVTLAEDIADRPGPMALDDPTDHSVPVGLDDEAPSRAPMPLARLAQQVFDDSSDYDDGVGGWTKASFNPATGVLVVSYERDGDIDPDFAETDEDYAHGSAEYRFRVVDDAPRPMPGPGFAVIGDYVAASVDECSCDDPGPEFGHRDYCGWQPVIRVDALTELGFTEPEDPR